MDYEQLLNDYMNRHNDTKEIKISRWEEKCNVIVVYYYRGDNTYTNEYEITLFDLITFVYSKI